MGYWDKVIDWLVKEFWPFFMKHIWPHIKQYVKTIVEYVIEKIIKKSKDKLDEALEERRKEALRKAEDAEKKAAGSSDEQDADKQRAIAKVWREVAEKFMQENAKLKEELEKLKVDSMKDTAAKIDNMDIALEFSNETPVLTIGGKTKKLPLLPK